MEKLENRKHIIDSAVGRLSTFEREALEDKYEARGARTILERLYLDMMDKAVQAFKDEEDVAAFRIRAIANEHKQEMENKMSDYEEEFGEPE